MRGRSCSRHSPSTPKLYEAMLLVKESETELETDARLLPDAAHRNRQRLGISAYPCVVWIDGMQVCSHAWMVRKRRRIYTRHCLGIYERLGAFLAVREAAG